MVKSFFIAAALLLSTLVIVLIISLLIFGVVTLVLNYSFAQILFLVALGFVFLAIWLIIHALLKEE